MRIFLVLIIALSFIKIHAQSFSLAEQSRLDSMFSEVENDQIHDTIKAITYTNMAGMFYLTNPDSAIFFCEKSLKHSQKVNYTYGMSEAYGWLAYLYNEVGKPKEALVAYDKSLPLAIKTGNKSTVAVILNNMAEIYSDLGKIEQSLQFNYKALELYESDSNRIGEGLSKINLGVIYLSQSDTAQAIKFFTESIFLHKPAGYSYGLAYSYNNLGSIYSARSQFDSALYYFNRGLEIRQQLNDVAGIALAYSNIGQVKKIQKNNNEALEFFNKSLELRKQIGDKSGLTVTYYNLGNLYQSQQNWEKAKYYAELSYELAKNLGYVKYIKDNDQLLLEVTSKKNGFPEVIQYHREFVKMSDSLNNKATQKAAAQQLAKKEYEAKKALDDLAHEKEIALEKASKKQQQIFSYFTIAISLLILAFLFFVVYRLRLSRKQNKIIATQKEAVMQQKLEIEEAHKEITDSINYAKRIQKAILPPDKVIQEQLPNSFVLYLPKDVVAGDFYWLEKTSAGVLIAAADCTGHGVPGAMVSVVCNNALNRAVREYNHIQPNKILDKTRELVIAEFEKSEEEVKDGMDIALCHISENQLSYAGANNPLWIIRKNEVLEFKANKQPIGKYENAHVFEGHEITLEKDDMIYIFSDGYPDQFGGDKGKKYKTKNLKEFLLTIAHLNPDQQKEQLHQNFIAWKTGFEQIDDVCIIGIRY